MGIETNRPPFEKCAETRTLEHRLRKLEIGEFVSYDELSKLLGRSVQKFCVHNLSSARNALSREKYVFITETGKGIRRGTASDGLAQVASRKRRAVRQSRRARKQLSNLDFDELTDEEKKEVAVQDTQLQMLEFLGGDKAAKKIETAITGHDSLPIGKTMEMFIK